MTDDRCQVMAKADMLNVYYPEIDTIYRFRMSMQILHWTNRLLIMSEMMTRVHLANMINVYNPEINIIYRCNIFYIGPRRCKRTKQRNSRNLLYIHQC
jgi:hypothetical protein